MITKKLLTALCAIVLTAVALAPASANAQGNGRGPQTGATGLTLLTPELPTMLQGETAWVGVSWQAGGDVDDLQVRATANKGVTITYPANTGDHSGPYGEPGIAAGGIDFTALKIFVPDSARGNVNVDLEVTWTEDGQARSDEHRLKLMTTRYDGQDMQVMTTSASVDAASGGWVEVAVAGFAPRLEQVQVTVTDSAGLTIQYPLGTHTSLHANSTLVAGETDVARFYVEPTDTTDPSAALHLEIRYTRNGGVVSVDAVLELGLSST